MSAPTARELIAQPHGLSCDELAKRVEAVIALHASGGGWVCEQCQTHLPCQTQRLLNGGQS